jgi:hypothetical protein
MEPYARCECHTVKATHQVSCSVILERGCFGRLGRHLRFFSCHYSCHGNCLLLLLSHLRSISVGVSLAGRFAAGVATT